MKNKMIYNWVDFFILFSTILLLLLLVDDNRSLPIIGYSIIALTGYLCYKLRNTKTLLLLFGIIGFINLSIGLSDLINKGVNVADWQILFRFTPYNNYLANSTLLFLAIINFLLSYSWIEKNKVKMKQLTITKKYNKIICYVGLIVMYIILFTTFELDLYNSSTYISNSNPMYEYAVIIFVTVWFYSGSNKLINGALIVYSLIYIFQSFFYGDRSAAFLMALVFFSLYLINKITLPRIFLLAITAIYVSNIVSELRTGNSENIIRALQNAFERGIYSDTVSFAYYASITITALNNMDPEIIKSFFGFVGNIFLGSSANQYSSLATYASDLSSSLYNVGGGLYQSYFYAWFGYLGVVIGAIVIGLILRFFFSKSKGEFQLYQVLIVSFSIRWYLYGPFPLFRSILFIFTILLLVTHYFNNLLRNPLKNRIIH